MMRIYEHRGLTVEVTVESDFVLRPSARKAVRSRYVAIVNVLRAGHAIATFSPLRFSNAGARPFDTEVDALMGGYSAGRRIVDDMFSHGNDIATPATSMATGEG